MSLITDDPENLFAPPQGTLKAPLAPASADFLALFGRWERYRLYYNAVLAAETIMGVVTLRLREGVIFPVLLLAIVANVCFCAGVVLNGYAWRLGLREVWVCRVLFGAGTLLAIVLTGASLVSMSLQFWVD